MKTPQRIIDANANRAREAMRVLEEAARFIVNDAALSQELKQMRHDFTGACPEHNDLVLHRDTPGDVGTTLTTSSEQTRSDLGQVIAAAGARLGEALRVIEEYSKLADIEPGCTELAMTAERLRYKSYDITQRLIRALGSGKASQWKLCLLLTQSLCTHHPWQDVLDQAVSNGVDCVQVREKDIDDRALLAHIREVQSVVSRRAVVIVNDRPDLALLAGADGVHLGQTDLNPREVRRFAGTRLCIGVSTANLQQAKAAKADGADYCGVGPMFATTTKHKPDLAGPSHLREFLAWDGLPHLAIGGINCENVGELIEAGVRGLAVSSAICSAKDPGSVAQALSQPLVASDTQPS